MPTISLQNNASKQDATVDATQTSEAVVKNGTGHGKESFDSRELLRALISARDGDFSVRLPDDLIGIEGKIADAFNDIMRGNETMARELQRVSHSVGREGKIRQRA